MWPRRCDSSLPAAPGLRTPIGFGGLLWARQGARQGEWWEQPIQVLLWVQPGVPMRDLVGSPRRAHKDADRIDLVLIVQHGA